jgi:hypothetical protein
MARIDLINICTTFGNRAGARAALLPTGAGAAAASAARRGAF